MIAPRIPPLADDELTDTQRALVALTHLPGLPATNIFKTLVRHPSLMRHWLPFSGKLLNGKLDGRDRELVILRVAWLCDSEYEWAQHTILGRQAGLADDEIARVAAGPDAADWPARESALLRAADELHETSTVSDGTWTALAEELDERQLVELVMLIGQYHMVAFALNALGVELEEGVEGYPVGMARR